MTANTANALIFTTLLLILSGSASSQIYKWVDNTGKTHFSSSPPAQGKMEIIEPKINTYTGRKLPNTVNDQPRIGNTPKKSVVMYSAVWCTICKTARSYFKKRGIAFKEYDVETSSKGRRDYKRFRETGVPIIIVGKKRINGFTVKSFQAIYDS